MKDTTVAADQRPSTSIHFSTRMCTVPALATSALAVSTRP